MFELERSARLHLFKNPNLYVSGVVFRIAQGGSKPMRSAYVQVEINERKESSISCRPRGLAKDVEPHQRLRVESPKRGATGREEGVL